MGLATINIKFQADLRGFSTEMQNSIRRVGQLGKELQKTGKSLSLYVSAPLLAAGVAAVKFASDYQESVNKVDVAFGPAANSIKEFAKTSLESFGIAEGTALDMAATYGDMATGMGLPQKAAANMSKSLVGLAGDLASFKNISIDVANTAVTGIFTGETESIKKLGIVMTEANVSAYALAQGVTKQYKDMTQAEKVALRYNYVLSVTKNAQGDFVRTGGGAANQMRIFQESLKQVAAQLGAVILPAFTKLISYVNGVIKSFSGLSNETKTTIVVIAGIATAIGPLLSGIGSLLTFVPNLISKINTLKDTFGGLNAIITANPYTALAVAVTTLVGGFYLWYANTKKVITAQETLNAAVKEGDKAAATEVGTLDRLYTASTNVKSGIEERKSAYKSLQEIYPAYFKNIDFENLKNAQAVGIYKELREAIFNKSRAVAIGNELQKRADERVQDELVIRNKIADTEAEILRLKKATTDTVIKGSAAEKTSDIIIKRSDQLVAQNKLLKIQRAELEKFTQDALASDQILLDVKTKYDAKTGKLTENEITRQKELMAANALQFQSNSELKANTIKYFESLIEAAQKEQKEVSLTGKEFDVLQSKIDGYQRKIDSISKSKRVLPKPELPKDEVIFNPSFSLEELKDQLNYYEKLRDRFSKNSDDFKFYSDQVNNTKIKIDGIEGVVEFDNSLTAVQQRLLDFKESVSSAFRETFQSFAEGFGELIGNIAAGGASLESVGGLIFQTLGNLAIQVGKIAITTGLAILGIKEALKSLNPYVAIGAGIALIALGTIAKSQLASAGAFANGGIVGGSSFYGDKILARVNSGELILNDKQQRSLYNMISTGGSGGGTIIPDVRVSGEDLLIVFGRAQANKNRRG